MELFNVLNDQVYDFILIFARMSGMVAFAPVFGAKNVPNAIKALIAFTLSVVFTSILPPLNAPVEMTTIGLALQMASEVTVGAAIGFTATMLFEIIIFAGYIIDYMIGFGFINIVDPQSGSSISLFAFFYSFLTLILFLLVDAHHILIEAMVRGYELIPVFSGTLTSFSMNYLVRMMSAIFYVGFQIAGPIFIIMFTVDFTLGMISKVAPSFQIMVVGFPLKIAVGLIAIGVILKPTAMFIIDMMGGYREELLWLMKYLGGGA